MVAAFPGLGPHQRIWQQPNANPQPGTDHPWFVQRGHAAENGPGHGCACKGAWVNWSSTTTRICIVCDRTMQAILLQLSSIVASVTNKPKYCQQLV